LAIRGGFGIADLYDSVELELATQSGRDIRLAESRQLASKRMHLRWADLVLSANERQLERARGNAVAARKRGGGPEHIVIATGVADPPPPASSHALRERFPEIGPEDRVILWWGTVWPWLDADTAIEAIVHLIRRLPSARLVFTAGKHTGAPTERSNVTERARDLARVRGLLGRNVFFIDDWIPYEERHLYLADADVGLTLHHSGAEAEVAARFRYMDYLWAGLPSVLAAGDETGAQFASAGAARLVPPEDASATAAALEALLTDRGTLDAARRACSELADRYRWPRVLAPLVTRVEQLAFVKRAAHEPTLVASEAARYYARCAVDRCLAALPE
jgi:hypothetical protein